MSKPDPTYQLRSTPAACRRSVHLVSSRELREVAISRTMSADLIWAIMFSQRTTRSAGARICPPSSFSRGAAGVSLFSTLVAIVISVSSRSEGGLRRARSAKTASRHGFGKPLFKRRDNERVPERGGLGVVSESMAVRRQATMLQFGGRVGECLRRDSLAVGWVQRARAVVCRVFLRAWAADVIGTALLQGLALSSVGGCTSQLWVRV